MSVPQRDVERAARAAGISLTPQPGQEAAGRRGEEGRLSRPTSRWVWQLPPIDRDAPAQAKKGSHLPRRQSCTRCDAFSEDDLLRAERGRWMLATPRTPRTTARGRRHEHLCSPPHPFQPSSCARRSACAASPTRPTERIVLVAVVQNPASAAPSPCPLARSVAAHILPAQFQSHCNTSDLPRYRSHPHD